MNQDDMQISILLFPNIKFRPVKSKLSHRHTAGSMGSTYDAAYTSCSHGQALRLGCQHSTHQMSLSDPTCFWTANQELKPECPTIKLQDKSHEILRSGLSMTHLRELVALSHYAVFGQPAVFLPFSVDSITEKRKINLLHRLF